MPSDPEPESTGLQPNEDRQHILHVSPGGNLSWPDEDRNLTYTIPSGKVDVMLGICYIFT